VDHVLGEAVQKWEASTANIFGGAAHCPRTSKSSRQSFIVNIQKNASACHSDSCVAARGGRVGGNVLDFVSAMENCSIREAALKLQGCFIVVPPPLSAKLGQPVGGGHGPLDRQ
jgi:hypothetical protein